ncbi:hypothetical protein [Leifsonia sp. NPDC080035]|uniref:Uncharacterized protein n=1 Tax=Leifsonia sp. NPDC080035 TaxID=3143936 RepID=A0AAU7GEF7_9MICO
MNPILIPLLQSAGAVALAVVSFAFAFTWPALAAPIQQLTTERSRLAAFCGVGSLLALAAAVVYVVPGLLLRDDLGVVVAVPIAATWAITAAALLVRGMLQNGVARVVSASFAVVAATGAAAGILTAVCAHHAIARSILPTGGFLLVVGALAAIVLWAHSDKGVETARA